MVDSIAESILDMVQRCGFTFFVVKELMYDYCNGKLLSKWTGGKKDFETVKQDENLGCK